MWNTQARHKHGTGQVRTLVFASDFDFVSAGASAPSLAEVKRDSFGSTKFGTAATYIWQAKRTTVSVSEAWTRAVAAAARGRDALIKAVDKGIERGTAVTWARVPGEWIAGEWCGTRGAARSPLSLPERPQAMACVSSNAGVAAGAPSV